MSNNINNNLFGSIKMGYIIIESNKLNEWARFGKQALGFHLESHNDEFVAFRMDSHQRRIIIKKGPKEDITALGWQVDNLENLYTLKARLAKKNIQVLTGSEEDAKLRGVSSFSTIKGPKGLPIEIFVNANTTESSLNMLCSGFETGECGMGHVAITSRQPEKMLAFWQEIFDARLSDYIEQPISKLTLDITFLRLNPRHHSVAIAATRGVHMDPIRTQIQHFNVEVSTLEDLTDAYERCKKLGYKMAHGIGQHPNDKELSFYVLTPSGFEMELGWAPIWVDEQNWSPTTHQGISAWGHQPENGSPLNRLKEIQQSVKSLISSEFTPF